MTRGEGGESSMGLSKENVAATPSSLAPPGEGTGAIPEEKEEDAASQDGAAGDEIDKKPKEIWIHYDDFVRCFK